MKKMMLHQKTYLATAERKMFGFYENDLKYVNGNDIIDNDNLFYIRIVGIFLTNKYNDDIKLHSNSDMPKITLSK